MHLILPYVVILVILLHWFIRKSTKSHDNKEKAFWDREAKANEVRRQDISKLNYISIPDNLPLINSGIESLDTFAREDGKLGRALQNIEKLKSKKILNLTGFSNTDLKLSYGVANLTELTEYDDNFTELAKALAMAGHELLELNAPSLAEIYLSFGIDIGSDITSNYVDMGIIYAASEDYESIKQLITKAEKLNSLSKDSIIRQLTDILNTYHGNE